MDNRLISSAWADFTYKMINEVQCPAHKHKLMSDWVDFSKKMKKIIDDKS